MYRESCVSIALSVCLIELDQAGRGCFPPGARAVKPSDRINKTTGLRSMVCKARRVGEAGERADAMLCRVGQYPRSASPTYHIRTFLDPSAGRTDEHSLRRCQDVPPGSLCRFQEQPSTETASIRELASCSISAHSYVREQ